MEGVDEDKGSMDQEVGKIIWSQMAILQALVMYLAVHREEGVEHKDKDKHQLEPRHVDKIPWTQMTASLALLTHLVIVVEVVDRVLSNKLTVMSLRMLKAAPPVTAVGVTVVLSAAFLPEFCGLHAIHVTDGFMRSVPILILTIIATSTMWTGYAMTVFNLYRPFMSP